jgi:hypothetical protein
VGREAIFSNILSFCIRRSIPKPEVNRRTYQEKKYPGMKAHACNPTYSGGGDRRTMF